MTASQIGYGKIERWVKSDLNGTHRTVLRTVAWVGLCLLVAQRLNPAALARAFPTTEPGSGISRLRRGPEGTPRCWHGPDLPRDLLTPRLVRAALASLPPRVCVVVALDTTRADGWEIWQAGLVFAGHTLPVVWAVMPYPWPTGRFRATTLALVDQLAAAFAPSQPWVLVARPKGRPGFPSAKLFARLLERKAGWTVRLRRSDWAEVGGIYAMVRDHPETGRLRPGERTPARIGRGTTEQPSVEAWIVVNTVIPAPLRHKQNPGTRRERNARVKAHATHLAQKGRKSRPPGAIARRYCPDGGAVHHDADSPGGRGAVRRAIEQTFRDWHHGWGLREAAAALSEETAVGRMVGIVCLAYRLQTKLGLRFSQDPRGRARRARWTVTDRVSYFWCAQQLFTDPGADWSAWLAEQWDHLFAPEAEFTLAEAA